MRFTHHAVLILTFISVFTACQNPSASQKKAPSVSNASKAVKTNAYRHFRGNIGSFPVTMDILETQSPNNSPDYPNLSGYYSYDKYQQPLSIFGRIDATGVVQLEESGIGDNKGVFKGKLTADSTFAGVWTDTLKRATYNFVLRETFFDGAVALEAFPFSDTLKLFEKNVNGPQAEFSMDALLPAKNTEGSLFEFLRAEIFKQLKGDSVKMDYANLQLSDVQKTQRDSFFKDYKEALQNEKPDSTSAQRLNFSESTTMEVVANADGLLTLGFRNYTFTGGAHGNYGTQLITFDVTNKKRMALTDIFKPNYGGVLNAALTRSARRYFGVKPNQSLKSVTFGNEIKANDNFAITRKGILFNYTPYEIASYAQGEIQLFIPFDELKSVLK